MFLINHFLTLTSLSGCNQIMVLSELVTAETHDPYFTTKHNLHLTLSTYTLTTIILATILVHFILRSFSNNKPKTTDISKEILQLTTLYLIIVLSWSLLMIISRIAPVIYNILIVVGKVTIFVLYLTRLKISLAGTQFSYQPNILHFLALLITIAYMLAYSFDILYSQYLYDKIPSCILKPQQLLLLGFPIISIDTISWFIILYLFLIKLHQIIIHTHLTEKDEMLAIRNDQLTHIKSKIDPIICVMSKLIICVLLSVII
eukprot:517537_1